MVGGEASQRRTGPTDPCGRSWSDERVWRPGGTRKDERERERSDVWRHLRSGRRPASSRTLHGRVGIKAAFTGRQHTGGAASCGQAEGRSEALEEHQHREGAA